MSDKSNVSEKVYNFIIDKIKSKEWEPNSKIMSENQLCKELNVSRVAVRPAIDKLVALGLLRKKRGAGTFVTNINASSYMSSLMPILLLEDSDILSILEFRLYFEYSNVIMFMKNHNDEDIEKLEYYFNEMKRNTGDLEKFYLADFNFHNVIANGTKNPIVIKINEILIEILKSHQAILYEKVGPGVGIEHHRNILSAIKAKDGEIAAMFMKRHIEAAIADYKRSIGV